ncbi:hypothetical protein Ancab_006963 [Ancistrocladus abbreviatus]
MKLPDSGGEFLLHPPSVKRHDRSAQSVIAPYDQLQTTERLADVHRHAGEMSVSFEGEKKVIVRKKK